MLCVNTLILRKPRANPKSVEDSQEVLNMNFQEMLSPETDFSVFHAHFFLIKSHRKKFTVFVLILVACRHGTKCTTKTRGLLQCYIQSICK